MPKNEGGEPLTAGATVAPGIRCDFCGASVPSVRRVALDHDYERLQTPHHERYACARCSEEKERKRLGLHS